MENSLPAAGLARLRRIWAERSFDRAARGILGTRPLRLQGDSPLFLSMVRRRDVIAYLLAIKSLYVGIGQGRVVIINEGGFIDDNSLSSDDMAILNHHVPGIEVVDLAAIATGPCPRGGTWERLVKIVELSDQCYVIQVDADTLVSATIPEVVECWQANKSFLLGTGSGQVISPAPDTARMVRGWIKTNGWTELAVSVEAEASLDKFPNAAQRSYVHASSGFAGFARGAFRLADLEEFSIFMSEMLGAQRWHELGSEQVASNYILANAPGAIVLPFPRYACFEPHLRRGEHAFLHFIGTYRYNDGAYRRRAAEFIRRYNRTGAGSVAPGC